MSQTLRKIIDIGPAGVIYSGSAQDLRYHDNTTYFADTARPGSACGPTGRASSPTRRSRSTIRSPGYWKLQALDEQIALPNARGIRVILMPYRFPTWASNGQSPTVFVAEGGARLTRMPDLYPAEDPREAQAKCLRDAWALHQVDTGAGAGVALFAQYLIYADPNFDCGLIDPYPSTLERSSYAAWKSFPRYA